MDIRFKSPTAAQKNARRHRNERARAVLAGLCFLASAVFCVFVPSGMRIIDRVQQPSEQQPQDDDLRTGSVVFVPILGNECRIRIIDNATWRMHDRGIVPCDEAFAEGGSTRDKQLSTARVEAIRDGFWRR